MRKRAIRQWARILMLLLLPGAAVASLAGCADAPPPPPPSFAPIDFGYLPKLRLNVADVEIEDHSGPVGPNDVAGTSPVIPAEALERLGRERLVAVGNAGTAHFVIDQASILVQPNGALDGQLGVHLTIDGPDGRQLGYAEAHVARQHIPGSDPEDQRTELYDLTRHMLEAMNVELEYQLRQSMGVWLVSGNAVPAPVIAQPLPPPPAPPLTPPLAPPAAPPADVPPAPPPSDGYQDPALPAPPPAPPQMSPPPGYLKPPPNGY